MAYELPDSCRYGSARRRAIFASAGRQLTATRLDAVGRGLTHGVDIPDLSADALKLGCDADCAECACSASIRSRRLRARFAAAPAHRRRRATRSAGPTPDDCGAAQQHVPMLLRAAPIDLFGRHTGLCVVNQIRQDYTGSVATSAPGQWRDRIRLASLVYLGISSVEPCPTCQGDVTAQRRRARRNVSGRPARGHRAIATVERDPPELRSFEPRLPAELDYEHQRQRTADSI
jgi:hypothetical protein